MALSPTRLSADIRSRLITSCGAHDDDQLTAFCDQIAQAVVSEITVNASVATTVAVTSVSGVTTGLGVSGPGSGSGTGTVS